MNKLMFLQSDLKPTPEIMKAWHARTESIADKQVDEGDYLGGWEISRSGAGSAVEHESMTGYNIMKPRVLMQPKKLHKATRSLS